MKQMKFFVVALTAIVTSMSVTSCMGDGDIDPTVQTTDIVRADYMGTFTNAYNIKYVPVNNADILTGDMYYIYFQYDSSTITENSTSIDVTLLATPVCIDGPTVQSSLVEPNAPIHGFNTEGYDVARMFDDKTLIIPFSYWYKSFSDNTAQKAELDKHSFILSYDSNAIQPTDKELKLDLAHVIAPDETETNRSNYTKDYKTYNLSGAIAAFESVTGSKPSKIVLNAKTNNSYNTLTNANNGQVTVNYE